MPISHAADIYQSGTGNSCQLLDMNPIQACHIINLLICLISARVQFTSRLFSVVYQAFTLIQQIQCSWLKFQRPGWFYYSKAQNELLFPTPSFTICIFAFNTLQKTQETQREWPQEHSETLPGTLGAPPLCQAGRQQLVCSDWSTPSLQPPVTMDPSGDTQQP